MHPLLCKHTIYIPILLNYTHMARNQNMQKLVNTFFAISLFTCSSSCLHQSCYGQKNSKSDQKEKYFEGMFVFGTSLVDNGNNNYIKTSLSKANYKPYGIDFAFGPTGRFSNGKNVADLIGDLLHLPLIPPFVNSNIKDNNVFHGVNYGSGGSGILDDTGYISGGVITLNQQIKNFEEVTLPELRVGGGGAGESSNSREMEKQKLVGRHLFLIAAGNNDFELNYFLQDNSTRPSLPVFVRNLTSTFRNQLKRLYDAGGRKYAVLTVYPIGCTPVVKQEAGSERCVQLVNKAARYYNTQLKNLVDELKEKMPGSEFVIVNAYKIIRDIIKNPVAKGFSNATGPCCELQEILGVGILCKENGRVCKNTSSYIFFDGQHNTEAANAIIAAKAFYSNRKTEAYPFNLQKLALAQAQAQL